jgi:hypothetical protein
MEDNSSITTVSSAVLSPSCKYPPLTARVAKTQTPLARQWQSTTISETVFSEQQASMKTTSVEPLMPVQMNPSNELLAFEESTTKRKQLAATKNNSWSPTHPRDTIPDTRMMPGSRNASKLKGYEKLYYDFSSRRLKKEDKIALSKKKKWEGPVLAPISSTVKIPSIDAHILPGRVMVSPNGAS